MRFYEILNISESFWKFIFVSYRFLLSSIFDHTIICGVFPPSSLQKTIQRKVF